MGETVSADHILETRGTSAQFDAHVIACAFDRQGVAAFGLGDGTVRLNARATPLSWLNADAHDGGLLALAAHPSGQGFVSGGDDGALIRTAADGSISALAAFGSKWVEQLAVFADAKSQLIACGVGKKLVLLDGKGAILKSVEHPSTVTGIAFDAKGKRVATSHYNGASLWFVASKSDNPRRLEWKGSHTGIAFNPDGDHVVTSMQENSLHGWRLTDGQHMRMSGYPSKTNAMSFTRNGKWLASSGAESIVLWPFFGGGPMGKSPTELAGGDDVLCSYLATHPTQEAVAAGFNDGLMVLADINNARILPIAAPGRGAVTAVAWSADGTHLAFGTETGFCAVVDFSKR
ncbi:MAG: WD40 repeat domain-containing protein [Acetobacteraceae bacterium]|nr:WD40 repeat domain-containing protein [Acetobacteraceae bacterium]